MKESKKTTGKHNPWDDGVMAGVIVLGTAFLVYMIFFLLGNSFSYEPLMNLLILILLIPALVLYFFAKHRGAARWKTNLLMLCTVLNFLAVALVFMGGLFATVLMD